MDYKFNEPHALPPAATPLERALYEYEVECNAYYKAKEKQPPENETDAEKQARIKAYEADWQHLQNERRKIKTLAQQEDLLEKYRKEHGITTSSEQIEKFRKEKHHPTTRLACHLTTIGEPKPSLNHTAHHIIPGKGRWRQSTISNLRISLAASNVRINDPRNGVWLPSQKKDDGHWATPKRPNHKAIHGDNYEKWIGVQLQNIEIGNAFRSKLSDIKTGIRNGTHPVKVIQSKDEMWNGME